MTRKPRIGIATPMANPTVEPEMRALLPPDVDMLVTRSVARGDSRSRLLTYFEALPETLDSFGGLALDAFGFACTASSYLLDAGIEQKQTETLSSKYGYPVITACQAIESALLSHGVRSLAIASPYPTWISDACVQFWRGQGFDVLASATAGADMTDTRAIYDLDADAAARTFAKAFVGVEADALLVTGTGLPTLALLPTLEEKTGMPVFTSNRSLAEACLGAIEGWPHPG